MTVHRDMRHVDESNGLIKAEIKREERENRRNGFRKSKR